MKIYVCMSDAGIAKAVTTEQEAMDWLTEQMIIACGNEEEFVMYYNNYVDVIDEIDCVEDANELVIMNIAPDFDIWYEETELDYNVPVFVVDIPMYPVEEDLLPLGAPKAKRSWGDGKVRKL